MSTNFKNSIKFIRHTNLTKKQVLFLLNNILFPINFLQTFKFNKFTVPALVLRILFTITLINLLTLRTMKNSLFLLTVLTSNFPTLIQINLRIISYFTYITTEN